MKDLCYTATTERRFMAAPDDLPNLKKVPDPEDEVMLPFPDGDDQNSGSPSGDGDGGSDDGS
jgi:hypothetical protein